MHRLLLLFLILLCGPVHAGQQKPLTLQGGGMKQMQPGDSLLPETVQRAPTSAALTLLSSTMGWVQRDGVDVAGDAPPLTYKASGSACTLNAGAGDGASQLPTSDGKCWMAAFDANGIDARQFGVKCNNSTDDTVRIQRELDAAGLRTPATVVVGGSNFCVVTGTLTVPAGVTLASQGALPTSTTGLAAYGTALNPMIDMSGGGSVLRDMFIKADAAGPATGLMVKIGPSATSTVRNIYMEGTCGAITVNGILHRLENIYVFNSRGAGCNVITVGDQTTLTGTVDVKIDHVVVTSVNSGTRPDSCFLIKDAGGLFITRSDGIYCKVGTKILPGLNQQVAWATFDNTYLGDTNEDFAFTINTAHASAQVKGLSCNACWASSAVSSDNVRISNTAGGLVTGLNFVGLRAVGATNDGMAVDAGVTDVNLAASWMCGNGGSNFRASVSVSKFKIANTTLSPTCFSISGASAFGILLGGSNANVLLTDLDVQGHISADVAGTPTGNSYVRGLLGPSNNVATIASSATIGLASVANFWGITGTAGISTINNFWNGREATLITTSGSISFGTGGNICTAFTSTQNVPISATYLGSCWYLK